MFKTSFVILITLSNLPRITPCVNLYGQCGGSTYNGSTECCSPATCQYNNDYYSQCLTGTTAGTTKSTPTPSSSSTTTGCNALYSQCGGQNWPGSTCCINSICVQSNDYYSQCLQTSSSSQQPTTASTSTTKASSSTTQPTASTTKASSSTTQSTASTTKASSSTTQPTASTTKASSSTTQSTASTTKASSSTTQPTASTTKASSSTTQPTASTTKASSSTTQSTASTTKASSSTTQSTASTTKASSSTTQSTASTTKASSSTTQPTASTTKASSSTTQSTASTTKASSSTTQPTASTTKASSSTTQPTASTTKASSSTTQSTASTTKASSSTTQSTASTTKASSSTTQSTASTTKASSSTTQSTASTTKASSSTTQQGCSNTYGQCGGIGWTGPTCCNSGSTCQYSNAYYSQCIPTAGASTSSSSTAETSSSSSSSTAQVSTTSAINDGRVDGITTRYWDCCKASCGWPGKASVSSPVKTCAQDGITAVDANTQSGCNGGSAYMCNNQQPWSVSSTLSYGYAAADISGQGESDWCCACYSLIFTTGPVVGKEFIVQVTNTGGDLGNNQFDLQMPGGGVGLFDGCSSQFSGSYSWGQTYGGISQRSDCYNLPSVLLSGCLWRFDWFMNADNPNMRFKQVPCPTNITNNTQCTRQ